MITQTRIAFGNPHAQKIVERDKALSRIKQGIMDSLKRIERLVEMGRLDSVPNEMDWIRTLLQRYEHLNAQPIPDL